MRKTARAFQWGVLAALLTPAIPADAQGYEEAEAEFHDELLHSDVPLFGYKDNLIPEHFSDDDGFGCTSRVALGDWTFRRADLPDNDDEWIRLQNYGVFHCAIVESKAYSRDRLDKSGSRYSFFVQIGKTRVAGKSVELWALQSGTRPGSDYLLLTRTPSDTIIAEFDVLQSRCPAANRREGPNINGWLTAYCAVNTRRELVALAKSMAKRPPLGKLRFSGETEKAGAADPAEPAAEAEPARE